MYSERMLATTRKVKSRNGGYSDIWGNPKYHVLNGLKSAISNGLYYNWRIL
nr:MAG TPA: hypothetical protein [Caudoviricetes sp.]